MMPGARQVWGGGFARATHRSVAKPPTGSPRCLRANGQDYGIFVAGAGLEVVSTRRVEFALPHALRARYAVVDLPSQASLHDEAMWQDEWAVLAVRST